MQLDILSIQFDINDINRAPNGQLFMNLLEYGIDSVVEVSFTDGYFLTKQNIGFQYNRQTGMLILNMRESEFNSLLSMTTQIRLRIYSEREQRKLRRKEFREKALENL